MPWRPSSLTNISASDSIKKNSVPMSLPTNKSNDPETPEGSSVDPFNSEKGELKPEAAVKIDKGTTRNTAVTVVIVEAKGLPDAPADGSTQGLYCKFRLGAQTFRTKTVSTSRHPQWRERFNFSLYKDTLLKIYLWHKGKQKVFMGSCVLDLSRHERDRTHDIWLRLDEGYGSVHLAVTMCSTSKTNTVTSYVPNLDEMREKYAFNNLSPNLDVIGQLFVKVICAKGLHGKPNAFCTLELDNEKVRTPSVHSSAEPTWEKSYLFNVYDVSSVLELKVMDNSLNSLLNNFLGRVSIPLLRISDGDARWYALKDANRRKSAKGNCPRVRLEIYMFWNPVTASLKLFRPKRVKYIEKPPKFDVALVYKNIKFIRDTFNVLREINEAYKRAFEWDDREYSCVALLVWLAFCSNFSPWMLPLALLLPFIFFCYFEQKRHHELIMSIEVPPNMGEEVHEETIANKIQGLPDMTFNITDSIEYLVSVAERLFNLVTFKVPFLSWLTMIILVGSSVALYYIPFRYMMMGLALYKFGRKQLYPERVLNNDLLDFISRIPDNKMLKDWSELSVPEPNQPERRSVPVSLSTLSLSTFN